MNCPRDRQPLERRSADHATTFACGKCAGRAVNATLLKRMMPRERFRELWGLVRAGTQGDASCPSCERPMRTAEFREAETALQVDACPTCEVIWFDAEELAALAPAGAPPAPVLDAPVPPDAGARWIWSRFFHVLNEKHFGGIAGIRTMDDILLQQTLEAADAFDRPVVPPARRVTGTGKRRGPVTRRG